VGLKVICSDQDNPHLYEKNLTNKIICLPKTTGSTAGGAVWETIASIRIALRALLFSEHIDSIAAEGIVLADLWVGRPIVAIDQLGSEFFEYVSDGQKIEIKDDGTVLVL
jgi:predicted aconitase with swiveling domain